MEGDLTLNLLAEASASGLLRLLDIDPRNRKSLIQLKAVLVHLRNERDKQYEQHELLTALAVQICMAIGNRDAYSEVSKSTTGILQSLRNLVRPDLAKTNKNVTDDITQRLMNMWRERFGDPDEAERLLRERDARNNAEAQQAAAQQQAAEPKSKIRNTQEFMRKHLFR